MTVFDDAWTVLKEAKPYTGQCGCGAMAAPSKVLYPGPPNPNSIEVDGQTCMKCGAAWI